MKSNGLFFRMESVDTEGAGEDASVSLEVNSDATQAVDEVESASGDVTTVDTGIENAETANTELGEVQETMEEAVEDGDGLSPREADMVNARLERIAGLLGTSATEQGLTLRRESFGSSQSRLTATKLRLEGLKEFGNKIWEALKRGWQWLKDAVGSLFASITKNADMVEKRLIDLRGRLAAIDGTFKQKETKMKVGAKAFSIKEKASVATITSILDNVKNIKVIFEKMESVSKPEADGNSMSESPDGSSKTLGSVEALKTHLSVFGEEIKLPKGSSEGSVGYGSFIGNQTIVVSPIKKMIGTTEKTFYTFGLGSLSEKTAEDYPALSRDNLSSLLENAIIQIKNVKTLKEKQPIVEKACEANIKFCEERSKLNDKKNDLEKDDKVVDKNRISSAQISAFNGTVSSLVRLASTKLPALAFKTVATAADVIDAGISNFKKEDKKK